MIKSKFRDRVLGLFKAKPTATFRIMEIEDWLKDIKKPVINYWLKEFIKDGSVVKPKYGHYRLNPNPPDIDAIRERVLEVGQARVIDTGRLWQPGEDALKVHPEHPTIPILRDWFTGLLDRMAANPASFSSFDINLLKGQLPKLASKEGQNHPPG
jgi:hypothetical protein